VFSCPRARVVVTHRSDVLPHQLLVPDAPPSPEVAADPAWLKSSDAQKHVKLTSPVTCPISGLRQSNRARPVKPASSLTV
jgi:hypothetical protein